MGLNVLIFEDEHYAAEQLVELLHKFDAKIEILEIIDTVKKGVEWLKQNIAPDLILMDVQLADGISFELFDYFKIESPIIFTTAYDEYAIRAFKVNSVDYLLKPIEFGSLANALRKLNESKLLRGSKEIHDIKGQINNLIELVPIQYRQRFLIQIADKFITVNTGDIMYSYIHNNSVFICDRKGQSYAVDYTLDKIQKMLDPKSFFRINRKYIIHLDSIGKMVTYSKYRIKIQLKNCSSDDVIVSRERVKDFKMWLDK